MKKIGIITIFKNINYGSKLQSYALQHTIKKLGYIGENISFQLNSAKKGNKILSILTNPSIIFRFFSRKKYHKREELFNDYLRKNLNVSQYSVDELIETEKNGSSVYSKFVCGSDQIWAPNQFNENFFLSFVSEKQGKIAYAPSIGLPKIPLNLLEEYKKLISNIGFISIREKDGARLIKDIIGKDVPVVLDPTLLLTAEDWKEHMVKPKSNSPYILCYFLGNNKKHRKWVDKLKMNTGYKIVVLPFVTRDYFWGDEKAFEVGPKEFIGLIQGAEIICTDSYHGMLFSINLNKEFYAFLRFKEGETMNQNSRVLNFLENLELKNRVVDLNDEAGNEKISWKKINNTIIKERVKSISFLKNALGQKNTF